MFTFLVFENYSAKPHIQSRLLSHKMCQTEAKNKKGEKMDIEPFFRTLSMTDSALNTKFICQYTNLFKKDDISRSFRSENVIFLHKYALLSQMKANLSLNGGHLGSVELKKKGKKYSIDQIDCELTPGLGGLHGNRRSVLKNVNKMWNDRHYWGDQAISFYSDSDFVVLNLDFQSYYINLLVQILKKSQSEKNIQHLLENFNKKRVELKKQKSPMDKSYKIAALAVTGNLNNRFSDLYNRQHYYSMTLNGQLTIMELIEF